MLNWTFYFNPSSPSPLLRFRYNIDKEHKKLANFWIQSMKDNKQYCISLKTYGYNYQCSVLHMPTPLV